VPDIAEVLADLDAESRDLDALVADLPEHDWARPTPAAGWTIAHSIAHLAWTDQVGYLSATDPQAFIDAMTSAMSDPDGFVDAAARDGVAPALALLARWRAGRGALADALVAAPRDAKLPWYGVGMSPVSMATGRIMETWAHGQDVADTLGVVRVPTARLRHVVHLATRTVEFSFAAHRRPAPQRLIYLELAAPDGSVWRYGPADASDRVTGSALDFCLVATHRRHRDDVALTATGDVADAWLDVIQTFAGPPGRPREPLGTAA
jgi:uncharacterized protein (TIGR03084 family)